MPEYNVGATPSAPPLPVIQVVQAPGVNVTIISPPVNYGPRSVATINLQALPAGASDASGFLHQVKSLAQHFAAEISLLFHQAQNATHRSPALKLDVARLQPLIGKSIDPAIAGQFLKKLDFDHIGRLVGAKPGAVLTSKDWAKLEGGVLDRHLTQTNAAGKRDVARTEREILLDLSGQLQLARASATPELQKHID
jgi:hypothetical protein